MKLKRALMLLTTIFTAAALASATAVTTQEASSGLEPLGPCVFCRY